MKKTTGACGKTTGFGTSSTLLLFSLSVMVILGMGACGSNQEMAWYKMARVEPSDFHTSRISLSWDGVCQS